MKKSMKRLLVIICVAAMLVGIIPAANIGQVNATELTEEKTVFEGKITSGTVTPGNGNNEECDKEGYVFGGYYNDYDGETFSNPLTTERAATEAEPIYIRWVPEEVMNVKAQVRDDEEDECKLVISNCDDIGTADSNLDSKPNTGSRCDAEGFYKEGEASIMRSVTAKALTSLYLTTPADVTGYKYFSCKIKIVGTLGEVSDVNNNGTTDDEECLYIVLTSDKDNPSTTDYALRFQLTQNELNEFKTEDGWYDLKLPFAQAEYINSANSSSALFDSSNLEFVQIRQVAASTSNVTIYIDDICALNENPGYLIADCDQQGKKYNLDGAFTYANFKNKSEIITKEQAADAGIGDIEGVGAIKNTYDSGTFAIPILMSDANKLNLSKYKEAGFLQFRLYISDETKINDEGTVTVQLSTGRSSTGCISWTIEEEELSTGWNEITKPFSGATDIETWTDDTWKAIDYFRIYFDDKYVDDTSLFMILDDVRAVDTVQITDCDSQNVINTEESSGHELSTTEDVMQGNYAFVQTASEMSTVHKLYFKEAIDFSGFKGNNGSLHFWFYIEDTDSWNPSETKGLLVRLNDGTYNQDYRIMKTDLREGWNEVYINLDKPAVDQSEFSWTAIQYLLLSCEGKGTTVIKTMIDDISLVSGNKKTADVRFVSTVESLEYKSVGYEISQSFSPDKPLTADTRDVYETLYELGTDGELDSVTPSGISGLNCSKRMYTATIVNLPNRLWDAVFTVTPYWVTQDGTKVTGEARELTMNYLLSVTKRGKAQTDFRVLITSDIHCTTLLENKTGYYYGVSLEDRMNLWVDAILEEHDRQLICLL